MDDTEGDSVANGVAWPNDLYAELTLVAAVVAEPAWLSAVTDIVKPADFSDPACRMIWTAIVDLAQQPQRLLTLDEIVARIEETSDFSKVDCGDVKSVRECVEVTLEETHGLPREAEWVAWRMREASLRRQLLAESAALKQPLIADQVGEVKSRIAKLLELSGELEKASSAEATVLAALNARPGPT
jgi:replicative DNA helicase